MPGSHFAELIIQLPSKYTSGTTIVYEKHTKEMLYAKLGEEDGTCEFVPHYYAYYAELDRDVHETLTGIRLSLVYYLFWTTGRLYKNKINIFNKDFISFL